MSAYNPIATMQNLETGGFERTQAHTLIGALDDVRADLATKADLDAGFLATRAEFKAELSLVKADIRVDLANLSAALDAKLNAFAWRICGAFGVLMGLGFAAMGILIDLHK
jgi:hypothetical protein